jgi:hypothetical protein
MRKLIIAILIALSACTGKPEKKYTVVSFYFGNYHFGEPRTEARYGPNWNEWELVRNAKPRFEGHNQPHVPLWGYTNEADPNVMAMKIDAAAEYGVDVWLFDWYWYHGTYLNSALDKGYLHAANNSKVKFALMWANHDWMDLFPKHIGKEVPLLYPGAVNMQTWDTITTFVIDNYFKNPNYWRIDGCPVFSIYEMYKFVEGFGSVEKAKEALDFFCNKAVKAGFKGINFNSIIWSVSILPNEKQFANPSEKLKYFGFESATSYVWIHHVGLNTFPATSYDSVRTEYMKFCEKTVTDYTIPYFPNVTMGWDPSPRCCQDDKFKNDGYPCMATMKGNTPEEFEKSLILMKEFLDAHPQCKNTFTINCWNEWTEGSYLEPDRQNGYKYLEGIKKVFGE